MLALPSPLLSSLEKTSSACARLVPPASSAFSNSDFVILPLPSASICENRSFMASCGLIDVDVEVDVELVEDWLWAAISALIVSGDICRQLRELSEEVAPLEVPPALLVSTENELDAPCVAPACCVEDDFRDVSDWSASSALDTAPRANNIAQLQ